MKTQGSDSYHEAKRFANYKFNGIVNVMLLYLTLKERYMNAIIMNGEIALSPVLKMSEAQERIEMLRVIYPKAVIIETDQEIVKKAKIDVVPEEVEDVGCAGGACTL